jgi:hypothetical protein
LICSCGYNGQYNLKMAFDVDEAYNFLERNWEVFTVRPVSDYSSHKLLKVHLHRGHNFTGHLCTKQLLVTGKGKESLEKALPAFLFYSGFNSVKEWIDKLVSMHGEKITYQNWGIYRVVVEMRK